MKISSVLFVYFVSFCLFSGHLSSDPDSVIVQSPEDNEAKTGKIQMEEDQEKTFITNEGPNVFVKIYMRSFRIGSQVAWREVRRETLDLTQFNPLSNFFGSSTTVQPNLSETTEKSHVNDNRKETAGDDKHRLPPNRSNNNNKKNSNPITSSPATTGHDKDYSEFEYPDFDITDPTGRISPDSNFFAGIVNNFAFKLIKNLDLESNFVISPLSIFVALSMCYLGSDGRTKAQLEEVLGMNDNAIHEEHLHQGIKDLLSLVLNYTHGYKMFAANGMFLGQNFTVDALFEKNVKQYYDAELMNLDFRNRQLSQQFINRWVFLNTGNMIKNIINSSPPQSTRLMLLNAVYFQGYWKTMFPISLTYTGNFRLMNRKEKEVRFMRLLGQKFPIFRSDEHKHTFIKLPYEDDEVSMIIALPFAKEQEPMPIITDEILCHMRDAMVDTNISTLAIPKFHLEYKESLIKPLLKLGIEDIFYANLADFRRLRKENDVHASAFLHKAVVEVNEAGTTASASTSIKFTPLSGTLNSAMFIANHPFAFYIVHEASGLVIFYGKVFDADLEGK